MNIPPNQVRRNHPWTRFVLLYSSAGPVPSQAKGTHSLTLSLPRSSIDDLVFSVFLSNFFKLSYKISLLKNRFVTLFFIRFS